ncbi:diguanylate cyclase [Aliidiomarina halalkaliphila]|uniref:Diguanylate cyclase n=2 Tax=Aliidiomarina halalkaliphila TaxID=2593535 RepID=A0A552X438_9GAMM|nr:diguanylate cyclase [Aliidiomarina halalkaliphila]
MLFNRLTIRLALSLTVALVVMMTISMWTSLRMQENTLREQAAVRAEQFASSQRIQLELALDTRADALRELKRNLLTWLEPHPELKDEAGLKVLFDSLWLLDRDGYLVDAWDSNSERLARTANFASFYASDIFQRVKQDDALVISEPVDNLDGYPDIVHFAYGLHDQGEFLGAIIGNIALRDHRLFRELATLEVGTHGYISIVSEAGKILFHPDPETTLRQLPEDKFSQIMHEAQRNKPTAYMNSFNNVPSMISVSHFAGANWYILVVQPIEGVYAPLDALRNMQLQVFGTGAVISVVLFILLLSYQLRPIRHLRQHTESIIAGDANFLPVPRLRELRPLVQRFNSLLKQNIKQQQALEERKAYFDIVLQTSPVGQFMTEPSGKFEFINKKLEELTGFTLAELRATGMRAHILEEDIEKVVAMWTGVLKDTHPSEVDFRFTRKDGTVIWLHVETTPVIVQKNCLGHVGTVRDVTSSYTEIENLRTLATIDALTGLLNRRGQDQALKKVIMNARLFHESVIVLVIDLDGFKAVNDEAGHDMGDQVLKRVAQILMEHTRETDFLGRMGGDEFILILPKCPVNRARDIAKEIVEDIALIPQDLTCPIVTASVGLTELREDDSEPDDVVRRADKAAYAAKHAGRNQVFEDFKSKATN